MEAMTEPDVADGNARCPHCAYPAPPRLRECPRCGHGLPRSGTGESSIAPALIATAVVLGLLVAARWRRRR